MVEVSSSNNDKTYSAAELPAVQPVLQQFMKLYPPVIPSTFINSPQKNNPGSRFDSIVFMLISFRLIPPAVTNSSLNVPEEGGDNNGDDDNDEVGISLKMHTEEEEEEIYK